jgi:oligoribonuclease NrnB/cAMP/cGMP phosphodiesterase (DHH superfamily)
MIQNEVVMTENKTRAYDVFNGDADGICALHQLRLAFPQEATLVTGVKRDIKLMQNFQSNEGDQITVLDISLDSNFDALKQHLAQGSLVSYFDHHTADLSFSHPGLTFHWDDAVDVCTSILVNRHLKGQFSIWANVAAFGDNLISTAHLMAEKAGLSKAQAQQLCTLGSLLNYNAYGEHIDDLTLTPKDLYQDLHQYRDPFDFIANASNYSLLSESYREDMSMLDEIRPTCEQKYAAIYVLPSHSWARRISGLLANKLKDQSKDKSFAVLTQKPDGSYVVSVRTADPKNKSASGFCSAFPTGGGRQAAAGINCLPVEELAQFSKRFFTYF